MPPAPALLTPAHDGGRLVVRAGGRWVVGAARKLESGLTDLGPRRGEAVVFDLGELEAIDTAGAWLLVRTRARLEAAGATVTVSGLPARFEPLVRQVETSDVAAITALPPVHHYRFGDFSAKVGRATIDVIHKAYCLLGFFGVVILALLRTWRHPGRIRFTSLVSHMERAGVDALPIVGLLSFLIGLVFAYQGADQLRRFGAEVYTVNMLGLGVLRELGALLTAIIVAGRSGSAFTAQIGTMKVSEEVDAMRTLGLDPIEILVLPRIFALFLVLPLLVFFANVMGLFGGALMTWTSLDIGFPAFLRQLRSAITGWTFWIGVVKAPFFAIAIALCGCYEGLMTDRNAESVGLLTTKSVVESIFLVIVLDAIFSIVFSKLGI